MESPPPQTGLVVEMVGDTGVVRFTQRRLLGADLIEAVAAEMLRFVEEKDCRKLILNLAHVESMTTAMVGKIVLLKRRIETAGGRLILCQLDPFLKEIFKVLHMADAFSICDDEPAALASF
jgi:anti-anti-sigma factor